MSDTPTIIDVQDAVKRIAHRLSEEWKGIDPEDIEQEVNEYLLKNWDSILKQTADGGDPLGLARGLAKRVGNAYCVSERYYWQAMTAEWIYTPREVRQVLAEYYFDRAAQLDTPKKPQAGRQSLEADGISIAIMDVRTAFDQISEQQQSIIIRAFQCGESLDASDRKRLQRAVDRITAILNRDVIDTFNHSDHDGPGSRQAITNTQARHRTDY